ncbi:MAG: septal ring lytic transglycosylase RlpA family protein [Niastella sp.]|nr:septal ring lytic transglycosylase RlpA family protein [Niastella sp.]
MTGYRIFFILLFLAFSFTGQAQTGKSKMAKSKTTILYGQASFYANKFHGRRTASGETFDQKKFTAACNSLPLGTWIKVTNLKNKKVIYVKVNDRLHPKTRRLLDLTRAAAQKLGYIKAGLTRVKIEVLGKTRPIHTT